MKDSQVWFGFSAVAFACGIASEYLVHERLCATLLVIIGALAAWIGGYAGRKEMLENMKVRK